MNSVQFPLLIILEVIEPVTEDTTHDEEPADVKRIAEAYDERRIYEILRGIAARDGFYDGAANS